MIQKLAQFPKTSPQNAYACLTKGLQSKLTFMSRTTPDMHQHFDTIENHIKTELITAITGKPNPDEISTSHFLTPFTITIDCPQENREIIYRKIMNLKNNLFNKTHTTN